MQAVVKPVIERWFTEGFRKSSPDVVARIERSFLNAGVEGYTGCCAAIRDMDQRKTIGVIKAPTMVIAGTFDPSTPPADGARDRKIHSGFALCGIAYGAFVEHRSAPRRLMMWLDFS